MSWREDEAALFAISDREELEECQTGNLEGGERIILHCAAHLGVASRLHDHFFSIALRWKVKIGTPRKHLSSVRNSIVIDIYLLT